MTMRTRPGNSHDDSRGTRLPFSHTPVKLGPVIVDSLAMERALTGACSRPRAFHLMGPDVQKNKGLRETGPMVQATHTAHRGRCWARGD